MKPIIIYLILLFGISSFAEDPFSRTMDSQTYEELSTFEGCKYAPFNTGEGPRVTTPNYDHGCSSPVSVCTSMIYCNNETVGIEVACIAKDNECPKNPLDCAKAKNAYQSTRVSSRSNYFNTFTIKSSPAADEGVQ